MSLLLFLAGADELARRFVRQPVLREIIDVFDMDRIIEEHLEPIRKDDDEIALIMALEF
jgi:hypothetical protein